MGPLNGIKVISMSTMLLGLGCQPSIFIYNFQLMDSLPIDALSVGPGTAEAAASLQTDYELTFTGNEGGQNNLIECYSTDGFDPDDITKVTPVSWMVAGPYYQTSTAYTELVEGTSLSVDWPMQVEIGGGSTCGRGEIIGSVTAPEGTLNLPKPSDYLQREYYPAEADIIANWTPVDGQAAFEEAVINGIVSGFSGVSTIGVEFQARACVDPLRITGDPSGVLSTSLHFLHVVEFEIEGKGNPCAETESTE